jgi:hypothetical protein
MRGKTQMGKELANALRGAYLSSLRIRIEFVGSACSLVERGACRDRQATARGPHG